MLKPTKRSRRSAPHADRRRYQQIIERYLADCYARRSPARVSELASLLTAARPYLSKVGRQVFGKPLRDVLRERQLEEACRLLRATDLPIGEISSASAFGTDKTFYRLFRAAFGMTPGAYRRKVTDCDNDERKQKTRGRIGKK